MARVIINRNNQLKRNQELLTQVNSVKELDLTVLTKRPKAKSWCVLEVIEHMNIAHEAYANKIDTALSKLSESSTEKLTTKATRTPSYLIKNFPPKDGVIKMKMKTFSKFKPVFDPSIIDGEGAKKIFDKFEAGITHIENALTKYSSKNVEELKFASAIGPIVKFNVAEACEFVICHNERHVQQIINTLKKVNSTDTI